MSRRLSLLLVSLALPTFAALAATPGGAKVRIELLVPEAPDPGEEIVASAAEVLSRLAGVPAELGIASDVAEARAAMETRPALALLSLPLYLEAAGRQPAPRLLASPRRGGKSAEQWHVASRAGDRISSLAELAGRRVAGTSLWDEWFVSNVLLPQGALHLELVPVDRALQGIKMLRAGEVAAIVLSDPERDALAGLVKGDEIVVVASSAELPLPPLVSFREPFALEARLLDAIGRLCADPEGSYLCEGFGIEGFGPPDVAAYREAVERYAAR